MGLKTGIEWCDSTVNPAPCCTGCELYPKHCYAAAICRRFAGTNAGYPKSFTTPTLFPERIAKAARWPDLTGTKRPKKPWLDGRPRMIFLNDLGDPFAPFNQKEWEPRTHWLHDALPIIESSPHIWMLLTKWPDRLRDFAAAAGTLPRNIWGGTMATSQKYRDRIWQLLQTPQLAVRFLSYEPAIGPLDLDAIEAVCKAWRRGATLGIYLDWVIAGGMSGPGAQPLHPDWARTIRDQCQAAGVPFFFKQWGAWFPFYDRDKDDPDWRNIPAESANVRRINLAGGEGFHGERVCYFRRVRKKAVGRLLDGREWNEMPEVATK